MVEEAVNKPVLELQNAIGFGGTVPNGLKVHPNRQSLIYPIGCTVVVRDLATNKQEFLSGHSNTISAVAVSKSGKYIASGQITHMGFKADIIVWDFETLTMYCKLTLHMVKIQDLAFSTNDKYLVSLGGEDDSGGSVVVWNLDTKEAICGAPAQVPSAGVTHCVTCFNEDEMKFATGGKDTLRIWQLDLANRKIRPTDISTGQTKRVIRCLTVAHGDGMLYCGTTTGDIMSVFTTSFKMQTFGPEKHPFSLGICSLEQLPTEEILVGSGDGTVAVVQGPNKRFKRTSKCVKVKGAVTSISLRGKGHQFFVGTDKCEIYKFNFGDFKPELVETCHHGPVNDLVFPTNCPELYVTSSKEDIRIWDANNAKELRRFTVPNMECTSVCITGDGHLIVSGWTDGRIRLFLPESGECVHTIGEAHNLGVTALAVFSDNRHLVSGGKEGDVRLWRMSKRPFASKLLHDLHEHKAAVTCVTLKKDDSECVTSSTDGTCIIWDLNVDKPFRRQMLRLNTLFNNVTYHPEEHQVIAAGTDRKISYWESADGSLIRELDASSTGAINALDVSLCGSFFVSGSEDKLVKVWTYDRGVTTHIGVGHSAPVAKVKISPAHNCIVSVGMDGSIIRWKMPGGDEE